MARSCKRTKIQDRQKSKSSKIYGLQRGIHNLLNLQTYIHDQSPLQFPSIGQSLAPRWDNNLLDPPFMQPIIPRQLGMKRRPQKRPLPNRNHQILLLPSLLMNLQRTKHLKVLPVRVNLLNDGSTDKYRREGLRQRLYRQVRLERGDLGAKVVSCCANGETADKCLAVLFGVCGFLGEED
jgi:hypothetical protein